MILRIILLFYLFIALTYMSHAQNIKAGLTKIEIEEMNKAISVDSNLSVIFSWFGEPVELYKKYKSNLLRADSIWTHDQNIIGIIEDLGVTEKFEMLPLIDWFTESDSITGESGVSYLIKTDSATILFDLGLNANDMHPSPLLKNMERLGISINDIDVIVISHNHSDHVGGAKWSRTNSFSFTNYQIELDRIQVYTPVEMNYPGLVTNYSPKPAKITEGVATIGVIHNPVFFTNIEEQALAINVKDRGIVIISGCGHQSMSKIIERSDILFKEPLFGILGGFHYPVEEGRNITWMHKYVVTGKLPWEKLTINDIYDNIELLKAKNVRMVGISGHDSCDKSIAAFEKEFGENYTDIKAGKKISISKQ